MDFPYRSGATWVSIRRLDSSLAFYADNKNPPPFAADEGAFLLSTGAASSGKISMPRNTLTKLWPARRNDSVIQNSHKPRNRLRRRPGQAPADRSGNPGTSRTADPCSVAHTDSSRLSRPEVAAETGAAP